MRDLTASFMRGAVCVGLVSCALLAAAGTRADELFGPDPAKPNPAPVPQCSAGGPAGPDLQSRIAQIQRLISAQAPGALPANGGAVLLNNAGYNYGPPNRELDQATLNFEAKQAR